jgi:hypothetical protein
MLDGLESLSGLSEGEKNLLPLAGFEPRVVQPSAINFRVVGTKTLRKLNARHEDERIWLTFVGSDAAALRCDSAVSPPIHHDTR